MDGWSFARRAAVGFGATLALIALLAAAALYALLAERSSATRVIADYGESLRSVERLRLDDEARASQARGYLLTGDKTLLARMRDNDAAFASDLDALRTSRDDERALLRAVRQAQASYASALSPLLQSRGAAPKPSSAVIRRYQRLVLPRHDELAKSLDDLAEYELDAFTRGRASSRRSAARDLALVIAISAMALSLGGLVAWLMTATLSRIHEESQTAARAQGELAASRAAYDELEALGYAMSHNLRAPARAMNAFSRRVLEVHPLLEPEARTALERISHASSEMGRMIDGLLQLLAIARASPSRQAVDFSRLAREALAAKAEVSGLAVTPVVAPGIVVEADPDLLRLLLDVLIDNALKFTEGRPERRVEIGLDRTGAEPALFVRDNGAGFDASQASQLFKPFRRLHGKTEFPGLGMGLAVAERVVRSHKGRIWAASSVGKGTTIYFTLEPGA